MVEWSITAVLKTAVLRGTGGSNPSLSAINLENQGFAKLVHENVHETPQISMLGAFFCAWKSCTPMYTIVHEKAPTISRGALFPQCNFEGFATMLCKGSEEFIKSSLYPQESSLSNWLLAFFSSKARPQRQSMTSKRYIAIGKGRGSVLGFAEHSFRFFRHWRHFRFPCFRSIPCFRLFLLKRRPKVTRMCLLRISMRLPHISARCWMRGSWREIAPMWHSKYGLRWV